jgi:hypothetical protein
MKYANDPIHSSPVDIARHIVRVTTQAWAVTPESPQALARRAPHGYEPLRRQKRQKRSLFETARAVSQQPSMAHSW